MNNPDQSLDPRLDWSHLDRFASVMPRADQPLDLRVLKAHLLAEEALDTYLGRKLPSYSAVAEKLQRARFAHKVTLAKAVSNEPGDWIWQALDRLNALRNSFAHRIDDKRRERLVRDFLAAARGSTQWRDPDESGDVLSVAFFLVCCDLGTRVQSVFDFLLEDAPSNGGAPSY